MQLRCGGSVPPPPQAAATGEHQRSEVAQPAHEPVLSFGWVQGYVNVLPGGELMDNVLPCQTMFCCRQSATSRQCTFACYPVNQAAGQTPAVSVRTNTGCVSQTVIRPYAIHDSLPGIVSCCVHPHTRCWSQNQDT
jgi:hypothetical protein